MGYSDFAAPDFVTSKINFRFKFNAFHFRFPTKVNRNTYTIHKPNDVEEIKKFLEVDGGDDPALDDDLGEESDVDSQNEVGDREENSASEQSIIPTNTLTQLSLNFPEKGMSRKLTSLK